MCQLLGLARENALLKLQFLLLYILLFTLAIEIKKPYGVRHEPVLELRIERTLCGQTWSMVHLDQPWLQLGI